jgi:ABC-type uncharacterized transport system permease subunit
METIGQILNYVGGIGTLVCTIIVIVKAFQNKENGWGIGLIIATLCACLPGYILGLIYGWLRAGRFNMQTLMIIYTLCFVAAIVGGFIGPKVDFNQIQQQMQPH